MGQYCRYCDHRCFVPDPLKSGWLLATCEKGMAHDRREVGYDIGQARTAVAIRTTEEQEHDQLVPRADRARMAYQFCQRIRGDAEKVYIPDDGYVAGDFDWPHTVARTAIADLVASGALEQINARFYRVLEWDGTFRPAVVDITSRKARS